MLHNLVRAFVIFNLLTIEKYFKDLTGNRRKPKLSYIFRLKYPLLLN